MASVSSNETMRYVLALWSRQNKPHVWLGGNVLDQEGIWKWTDCTHWEFEFWAPTNPDNSGGVEHCCIFLLVRVLTILRDFGTMFLAVGKPIFCVARSCAPPKATIATKVFEISMLRINLITL